MFKHSKLVFLGAATWLLSFTGAEAANAPIVGLVNFKTCVEKSKLGKQEQANFDSIRKQMETVLAEKEKTLTDLSAKIEDSDYMDSLSKEKDAEIRHQQRALGQELMQHQQQFYQILQQANFKIVQQLTDEIRDIAKTVAKNKKLDLILNEEQAFFYSTSLDVSDDVVKLLDEKFEKETKKS